MIPQSSAEVISLPLSSHACILKGIGSQTTRGWLTVATLQLNNLLPSRNVTFCVPSLPLKIVSKQLMKEFDVCHCRGLGLTVCKDDE